MTAKAKTVQRTCACGATFTAKVADVKRGWAKSCSKSCAAIKRERKTGAFRAHLERQRGESEFVDAHLFDNCE